MTKKSKNLKIGTKHHGWPLRKHQLFALHVLNLTSYSTSYKLDTLSLLMDDVLVPHALDGKAVDADPYHSS